MEKKITQENFEDTYVDSIELERIDKFVCDEMARQIHRYIKAMKGSKAIMLKFEEQLATLTVPEKEKAIARYIDLNRKVISGLDFKVVLARAMANYSDTFAYLVELVNNKRKMVFYLNRIREKYEQYHEVYEENGKFGIKDHQGNVLVPAHYDFLRTPYVYVDDLRSLPGHRAARRQDGPRDARRQGDRCARLHLRRHRTARRTALFRSVRRRGKNIV